MRNIDRGKIGIILIIFAIVIFIVIILKIIPKQKAEITEANIELSQEQTIYLLKHLEKDLTSSDNLAEYSFSTDEMVKFALAYAEVVEDYKSEIKYDEENAIAIIDIKHISKVVSHIFDVDTLDTSKITYKMENGNVYIPLNLQGGDAQVYKYKKTEYNEENNTYIVHIDCLELMGEWDQSVLNEESEYNEEDALYTLLIKYKIIDGRKVLLAYTLKSNIEY